MCYCEITKYFLGGSQYENRNVRIFVLLMTKACERVSAGADQLEAFANVDGQEQG